jgi:hypothetical protein
MTNKCGKECLTILPFGDGRHSGAITRLPLVPVGAAAYNVTWTIAQGNLVRNRFKALDVKRAASHFSRFQRSSSPTTLRIFEHRGCLRVLHFEI